MTNAQSNRGFTDLANIVSTQYGVGIYFASRITIEWALGSLRESLGVEVAERQRKAWNRRSKRLGGHQVDPIFDAYFMAHRPGSIA